jgi:hypothetical protein
MEQLMVTYSSIQTPQGSTVTNFPGSAFAVTPSDTTDYETGIAVFIVAGGKVTVKPYQEGDETIVIEIAPDWSYLPFRVSKVYFDTTATIIGIY